MKTKLILIVIALASSHALADIYRLKFPATVDVVDGGKVIGTKRLKAGTMLAPAEHGEDSIENSTKDYAATKVKGGALRLSKLSPVMFMATKPTSAHVFNAEAQLDTYYNRYFDEREASYWSVKLYPRDANWEGSESWYGYAKKNSSAGKRIVEMLSDGNEHRVRVKVMYHKADMNGDTVTIDAIEPAGSDD